LRSQKIGDGQQPQFENEVAEKRLLRSKT